MKCDDRAARTLATDCMKCDDGAARTLATVSEQARRTACAGRGKAMATDAQVLVLLSTLLSTSVDPVGLTMDLIL